MGHRNNPLAIYFPVKTTAYKCVNGGKDRGGTVHLPKPMLISRYEECLNWLSKWWGQIDRSVWLSLCSSLYRLEYRKYHFLRRFCVFHSISNLSNSETRGLYSALGFLTFLRRIFFFTAFLTGLLPYLGCNMMLSPKQIATSSSLFLGFDRNLAYFQCLIL